MSGESRSLDLSRLQKRGYADAASASSSQRLPSTRMANGIVVITPTANSATPAARRELRSIFSEISSPTPTPSATRVPAIRMISGSVRFVSLIAGLRFRNSTHRPSIFPRRLKSRSDERLRPLPRPHQRPILAPHRITRRKLHSLHPLDHRLIRRFPADIPGLPRRIGPNHKKVVTGLNPAMSRPGRQHGNVAGPDHHLTPALAAQHQLAPALRKPKHLMCGRVKVVKVIHSIPPLRRPPVRSKDILHYQRRVAARRKRPAIQQHWKLLIVRHPPIALEQHLLRNNVRTLRPKRARTHPRPHRDHERIELPSVHSIY